VKEGRWEFVVFCNVEDGLPFPVLLVIVEGEGEHTLNVVSVCCRCSLGWLDR